MNAAPRPRPARWAAGGAGGWRRRKAACGAVHQQVLRSFATTGRPPKGADLAETAAQYATTTDAVLASLHAEDFLQLDAGGQIRAAYPFSAVPTPHRVDLDAGPRVHATCAIDALGIAAMLHAAVTITSADPRTGGPVTITVHAGGETAAWQPPAAVVFAGTSREPCHIPPDAPVIPAAADVSCGYVNFVTTGASAAAWASAHPDVTGEILDQATALRLGTAIFGHLLADDP